jgi:2-keto-3-deoxy-L-rhamnonate aldolase RhmA
MKEVTSFIQVLYGDLKLPGAFEMKENFRQKLLSKSQLIGTVVTIPSPSIAEMLSEVGYDWLFVDAEHAPLSIADIQLILQSTEGKCPCMVRVPTNEEVYIKQVLDIGAVGIIAPLVNTPEEARRVVSLAKYPPLGTRSVGIARAHRYGRNFTQYIESANDEITIVIQVEHIQAAQNIDAILGVEGIDAVFLGPYDLAGSLGKPGKVRDSDVQEAISRVKDACLANGKPIGIFGINADSAKPFLKQGYSLVAVGTDAMMLLKASEETLSQLRQSAL